MGESIGEGERRREKEGREERRETKISGLYREETLEKGQPNPWAVKFRT